MLNNSPDVTQLVSGGAGILYDLFYLLCDKADSVAQWKNTDLGESGDLC